MSLSVYDCSVCGRHVEELVNITPGLTRPGECARCWYKRTGGKGSMQTHTEEREEMRARMTEQTKFETEQSIEQAMAVSETAFDLDYQRTELAQFLEQLASFEITTDDEMVVFGEMLDELKGKQKTLEAQYAAAQAPHKAALAEVKATFAATLEAYEQAEKLLKDRLAVGQQTIAAQNARALASLSPSSSQSEIMTASAALQSAAMPEGVHTRAGWDYLVTDLSHVPREFLALDAKKIRAHISKYGDKQPIIGIVIKPKVIVVATGTKT